MYRQSLSQINYSVNIVLTNGLSLTQVQPPTNDQLTQALTTCSQAIISPSSTNAIYTQSQAFSIDICGGGVNNIALNLINNALYSAWLEARPGKHSKYNSNIRRKIFYKIF